MKLIYRIFQKIMFIFVLFFKFREPIKLKNKEELLEVIIKKNKQRILLLSGNHMKDTAYYKNLKEYLEQKLTVFVNTTVPSDPDITTINKIVKEAKENKIDLIIGIGGGSTMDATKIVSASLTNKKPISKMKGMLKIKKKPLDFILIPTTAGTGSECTVAAVISDKENNLKYAVNDPKLIPEYALLDPLTLESVSPFFTSTTGLDALTHAVEAYIGKSNTKKTKKEAKEAIQLIFDNLYEASTTNDLIYKEQMMLASYKAGLAITKAYVGYVHAISHSIAAYHHYSHGYLNAILLPRVLKEYGKSIYRKIGKLTKELGYIEMDASNEEATNHFINMIEQLNSDLNIKSNLDIKFTNDNIDEMIKHCKNEVKFFYPVPCYLSDKTLKKLYNTIGK